MNILLSSAGRQVFLVEAFKEALNGNGKVIAIDYDKDALSLNYADESFVAPPFNSEKYIPWIVNLCKKQKISLLLTMNVEDLLVLELARSEFTKVGCFLVGGEHSVINMTCDKYQLSKFCNTLKINTPKTFSDSELELITESHFPIIAKPRYGKGSRDNVTIHSNNELLNFCRKNNLFNKPIKQYIFQKFIEGAEYGLDIINNFHSEFSSLFVRKKISMKNGETHEAITQSNDEWINIGRLISQNLKHQGTVDVDFMTVGGKKYLIDINHRFGGGYIFSHNAGAHLPKAYVNWFLKYDNANAFLNPRPGVHSRRDNNSIKTINGKE